MKTVQKVVIYVVKNDQILVFKHPDYPIEETWIQVPAGTVKPGEDYETAAFRELQEETGKSDFQIVKKLGVQIYDVRPRLDELQEQHYFLAEPTTALPQTWEAAELHDGTQLPTRFDFFWIPITESDQLAKKFNSFIEEIST